MAFEALMARRTANRTVVGDRGQGRAVGGESQPVELRAMGGQAEGLLAGVRRGFSFATSQRTTPRRSANRLLALSRIAGQEPVALVVVFEGAVAREINQVIGNDGVLRHEHVVCLPDRVAVLV